MKRKITLLSCCCLLLAILLFPDFSQAAGEKVITPILSLLLGGDTVTMGGTCAARGLPGPETVNNAGHEWQRCDDGSTYNWDAANAYCANLSLDGHSDWRLPTKDELKSLVVCTNGTPTPLQDWYDPDTGTYGHPYYCGDGNNAPYESPTIDPSFQCESSYYWSASTSASNPDGGGWVVYFDDGIASWENEANRLFVRCVRSGL